MIRERPRWALIAAKPGQGDEIVKQLHQWRKNGAITTDIGYRTWTSSGGEVSITAGKIGLEDLGSLHVFDAHPSFTESCCKAFLKAMGIKHPVVEVFENCSKETIPKQGEDEEQTTFACARIVSMQIPREAASKIEAITREFEWEGDLIRVTPLRKPLEEEQQDGGDEAEPMQIEEPQRNATDKPKRKIKKFQGLQGTDDKVPEGPKKSGRDGGREEREEEEAEESESDSSEDEAMRDAEKEKVTPEALKPGVIVRAPQLSSWGKATETRRTRFVTLKLVKKSANGWTVERLDSEAVSCKTHNNGHGPGWLVGHKEAKDKKCHSAQTRWFKGAEKPKEAEEEQKRWQAIINGGELVTEDTTNKTEENKSITRYSLEQARMCDDLEVVKLAARAKKDDPIVKEAQRINKQRSRTTKIVSNTKKQRKDGDGTGEDADGFDGNEADMPDA